MAAKGIRPYNFHGIYDYIFWLTTLSVIPPVHYNQTEDKWFSVHITIPLQSFYVLSPVESDK